MNNNDHRFDTARGKESSPFERHTVDAPVDKPEKSMVEKGISVALRIVAFILLSAVLLYLVYTVVLHPIDKLKLKTLFAYSYTVECIVEPFYSGSYTTVSEVVRVYSDGVYKFHGNYYKENDGKIYKYNTGSGKWYEERSYDGFVISEHNDLFDKKYFKFDWTRLFTWKMVSSNGKKDVGIYLKHRFGKFTYEIENDYPPYKIIIDNFNYSFTPRPWEVKN